MRQRFAILQVIDPHYHQDVAIHNMAEAEQLVETFGGEVVSKSVQHRPKPSPNFYIGEGKVEWLKQVILEEKIEVVVLNDIVNSGQLFRLEKTLWEVNKRIQVWDRVDLILNIFEQHATTTEAKLQIDLARIHHMGPRIYGLGGTVLSRQGGGIGTRGLGETNLEIERRKIKKIEQKIRQQLKLHSKKLAERIAKRQELRMKTVALVGYTSAGKTTLFNALTSKEKVTKAALFTTLDTVVGKLKIAPHDPTVLISDTIGFIEDLPPFMIDAFRSTLAESLAAQVLLHVIDASDPHYQEKIEVVNSILAELGVKDQPLLVFNKIDLIKSAQLKKLKLEYPGKNTFFISAKTGVGLAAIKSLISRKYLSPKPRLAATQP